MLLMFGIGTHFSLRELLAVKSIAMPGALRRSWSRPRSARRPRGCGAGHRAPVCCRPGAVGGEHRGAVLVLGIIVIGNAPAACALVVLLRRPLATALSVAAALAQIGEFPFILAVMGVNMSLPPPQDRATSSLAPCCP